MTIPRSRGDPPAARHTARKYIVRRGSIEPSVWLLQPTPIDADPLHHSADRWNLISKTVITLYLLKNTILSVKILKSARRSFPNGTYPGLLEKIFFFFCWNQRNSANTSSFHSLLVHWKWPPKFRVEGHRRGYKRGVAIIEWITVEKHVVHTWKNHHNELMWIALP